MDTIRIDTRSKFFFSSRHKKDQKREIENTESRIERFNFSRRMFTKNDNQLDFVACSKSKEKNMRDYSR